MAKDDVIGHDEGVLTSPMLRPIEMTSLEDVEAGLDPIEVAVTLSSFACKASLFGFYWHAISLAQLEESRMR